MMTPSSQSGRPAPAGSTDAAIDWLVDMSATIPGWRQGPEAKALAMAAYGLGPNPTIVEVGVFMGRSTLLLAGARCLQGSGRVHCIDPFDCSGDEFSVPHYRALVKQFGATSLEEVFGRHMQRFRLERMIEVHKGTSREIVAGWNAPIDLLLLDADHSPEGAREAFDQWTPFARPGGMVVLDNTADRAYAPTHDGNYRLAKERLKLPRFTNVCRVEGTTFATYIPP
jgi:predicted O-methyltransferase YrrM